MQEGDPPAHLRDDALSYMLGLVGDDEHCLAFIEARYDLVSHIGIHVHADQGEHSRRHAKEKSRRRHDQAVEGKDHASHIQGVILLHNGADDVKATSAAIHAEDYAVANAVEDTTKNSREHDVIDGSIGIQRLGEIQEEGKDSRTYDDVKGVAPAQSLPGRQKQGDIVEKGLQAYGQMAQVVDNDGNARGAACQQVRRHQKEVDGTAGNKAAQGDTKIPQKPVFEHLQLYHSAFPPILS